MLIWDGRRSAGTDGHLRLRLDPSRDERGDATNLGLCVVRAASKAAGRLFTSTGNEFALRII